MTSSWIYTACQYLTIAIGLFIIIYDIFRKRRSGISITKRIFNVSTITGLSLVVLSIISFGTGNIIESRKDLRINDLEQELVQLKPHLKIIQITPNSNGFWPGYLEVVIGNDENKIINNYSIKLNFNREYSHVGFNSMHISPGVQTLLHDPPVIIGSSSKEFIYTSTEPLRNSQFLFFYFHSKDPIHIISVELFP